MASAESLLEEIRDLRDGGGGNRWDEEPDGVSTTRPPCLWRRFLRGRPTARSILCCRRGGGKRSRRNPTRGSVLAFGYMTRCAAGRHG